MSTDSSTNQKGDSMTALPTDVTYTTIDEFTAAEQALIQDLTVGTANGSQIERLFCTLAHQEARGEPHAPPTECAHLHQGCCAMTGSAQARCLFSEPGDPLWERIRASNAPAA